MVDEIAVHDGLAVSVLEHGRAENVHGMERGRRGQPDTNRVKVGNHGAVFTLEIALVSVQRLRFAHLAVKDVTPVRLVRNHKVVIRDARNRRAVLRVQDALDHALYCGYL